MFSLNFIYTNKHTCNTHTIFSFWTSRSCVLPPLLTVPVRAVATSRHEPSLSRPPCTSPQWATTNLASPLCHSPYSNSSISLPQPTSDPASNSDQKLQPQLFFSPSPPAPSSLLHFLLPVLCASSLTMSIYPSSISWVSVTFRVLFHCWRFSSDEDRQGPCSLRVSFWFFLHIYLFYIQPQNKFPSELLCPFPIPF